MSNLSPGLILILGALLVPLVRGRVRAVYLLALPIIAFLHTLALDEGAFGQLELFDMTLTTLRVDRLSLLFGYIFLLAALLGVIYAIHLKDTVQHVAALIYAGSAVAAVFSGDLLTLFVYWEVSALASVCLIWASRTERAYRTGMRYLIIQIGSGVLLLAGVLLLYQQTGSIAFDAIGLETTGGKLIFLAFGIKCAFPLLHNWLQDAYPEATVTGAVVLSVFTTKLAVYALARSYAGTDILIPIGAVMTAFPVFYAVLENDLRRVLSYSLNNQLGFMVVGVGIGTELSLNGTAAHAFCHILYKALLFMSMGAVLYRVGTTKASELGGLYKSMPWTAGFCIVGAASISAFPLFSGFVSKAMILSAAMDGGYFVTWLVLLFASAGVVDHSGIKVPYFSFFAHDSGRRCEEAPTNMLIAMGIAAFLCIAIGVFPAPLYGILPFAVEYRPYTLTHVVSQMQLLMFAVLAFVVLMRRGIYPPELRSVNLDFDWTYRRAGKAVTLGLYRSAARAWARTARAGEDGVAALLSSVRRHSARRGVFAQEWPTGVTALLVTAFWAAYLLAGLL